MKEFTKEVEIKLDIESASATPDLDVKDPAIKVKVRICINSVYVAIIEAVARISRENGKIIVPWDFYGDDYYSSFVNGGDGLFIFSKTEAEKMTLDFLKSIKSIKAPEIVFE